MSKKGIVLVLLVFFLTGSLVFAGGSKDGSKTADSGQDVKFNVGFTIEEAIDTLMPDESWQYVEMGCIFWPLVYDQLWIMGPAPDYKPLPMLAESWETKDNQTWVFHLRKNAEFHDGVAVTAADVEFSFTYYVAATPTRQGADTDFTAINVIDDYTIEVTMRYPGSSVYPPAYWFPILPKHIWEVHKDDFFSFDNAEAIGSGPFQLKEFMPGQYIWLGKNDAYWGNKPNVDDVILKTYGGGESEYAALKKGEIDMIGYNGIDPLALKSFDNAEGVTVKIDPGITMDWLTFNLHKDNPISDINVRKAIMYSIDKDRIIDMAALGYADSSDSFIYSELSDHNPNLEQYAYNTAKARQILKDSGYKDTDGDGIVNDPKTGNNLSFELLGPSDWPRQVKTIKLIREQLKESGIDIVLKIVDLDTYYAFWYEPTADNFDIAISAEEPGPYANWIWEFARSWNNGGEGWNCAYYNNADFDEILNTMYGESDPEKRRAELYEMQNILNRDLPYGFLLRDNAINPVRTDKFSGYESTMGGVSTWINPWTYFNVKSVK